jgi:hypothetical protein
MATAELGKIGRLIAGESAAGAVTRLLGSVSLIVLLNHFLEIFDIRAVSLFDDDKALTFVVVVIAILALELIYTRRLLSRLRSQMPAHVDPRIGFANAAVDYALHLQGRQKNRTILILRANLSRLFHLMGLHSHRIRLGQVALNAATLVDDPMIRAEVFLDDLGWAEFMNRNKPGAVQNIKHALKIVGAFEPATAQQRVARALLEAKAHRHLAMLTEGSDALILLGTASKALEEVSVNEETSDIQKDEVARDQAQILHAEATLIARDLGVAKSGQIPAGDSAAVQDLARATKCAEQAEDTFKTIGDVERQAKALELLERLYGAAGNNAMVLETSAKRRYLLQISSIDREVG